MIFSRYSSHRAMIRVKPNVQRFSFVYMLEIGCTKSLLHLSLSTFCSGTQSMPSSHNKSSCFDSFPSSTHHFEALDDDRLLRWAQNYMENHGAMLSDDVYLTILKACVKKKSIITAKKLQSHIISLRSKSSEIPCLVNEHLILALAKCGAIDDAIDMFDGLRVRTVFSWTAIISGFMENGRHLESLHAHEYMQVEGVEPDRFTFISLFQACGNLSNLEKGKELHTLAKKKGLSSNVFVGNTLVNMYGKCGSIPDAEYAFSGLVCRSVVSWTAMISAYVKNDCLDKALLLYRQMREDGVTPNNQTFASLFHACGILADTEGSFTNTMVLKIGIALHVDALRAGYCSDLYVGTTLIGMYSKCKVIEFAESVFTTLSKHNVASWTAMLSAFVEQDQGEKALLLYRQMCEEGVRPNQHTLVSLLQACCTIVEKVKQFPEGEIMIERTLYIGQSIHADIRNNRFPLDSFLGNTLLRMYGKHESIREAETVLVSLLHRTVVSWTSMILSYVEQGQAKKALLSYRQMHEQGIQPNQLTFVTALQACGILADLTLDQQKHMRSVCLSICQSLRDDVQRMGFSSDLFIITSLLIAYGKCGSLSQAEEVFYGSSRCDNVMWNAMLSTLVEQSQTEKVLQLYKSMKNEEIPLDDITIITVLQACSEASSVEPCRELHFNIVANVTQACPHVASSLIHAYGRCASRTDAEAVYDELTLPDVVSSNAFMAIYGWEGNGDASITMLQDVLLTGMKPDAITFAPLLSACNHDGSVKEGIEFMKCMKQDYDINPDSKHYLSIADLVGRAGDFNRFEDIRWRLSVPDNVTIRPCVYDHGNVNLKTTCVYDHEDFVNHSLKI